MRVEDGKHYVRCTDCGKEVAGRHESLCACGAKLMDGRNAGLRCVLNANRTPELPNEICVEFVGEERKRKMREQQRPSWLGTEQPSGGDMFDDDESDDDSGGDVPFGD